MSFAGEECLSTLMSSSIEKIYNCSSFPLEMINENNNLTGANALGQLERFGELNNLSLIIKGS